MRVALPGVQVLFGFLLAVPFQKNFTEISAFEKKVYLGTLLCAAISAALLISPTAYHRITFHLQRKHQLIALANRFAIIGLGFLALAMAGAVMLITNVLFGSTATTAVVTVATISMFGTLWYLLPLRQRKKAPKHGLSTSDHLFSRGFASVSSVMGDHGKVEQQGPPAPWKALAWLSSLPAARPHHRG